MHRRNFLGAIASSSALILANRATKVFGQDAPSYIGLHPFIEAHPDSVFIKRTNVLDKTDSAAKLLEGSTFASEVFTLSDTPGIPLTNNLALKPNLTTTLGTGGTDVGNGIITDVSFMEGFAEGIKSVGFPVNNLYLRDGSLLPDSGAGTDYLLTGYPEMAQRTGVHYADLPGGRLMPDINSTELLIGAEAALIDCPNGIVLKRFKYVFPFNFENTTIIDISKFKAHSMGMSLCTKNLQGMAVHPYIHFCAGFQNEIYTQFQPDYANSIQSLYDKHAGYIPRWDRPGQSTSGGYGMEMWAQRTMDSYSISRPNVGLAIVEGLYGRNGNGFNVGPGPGGTPQDFPTNVLIFGKDPVLVDIIGHYIAGHEPGNFGLFHIAKERGFSTTFNPAEIPVYEWKSGGPQQTPFYRLSRFALTSPYLRRNYDGQNEAEYHLVNEPYDYTQPAVLPSKPGTPYLRHLGQKYQARGEKKIVLEYGLPDPGFVQLDVFNDRGQRVGILCSGMEARGIHSVTWDSNLMPAGNYYCRLVAHNIIETVRLMVVR